MESLPVTLAIRDYEFVAPLALRDVAAEGVDLTLIRIFDAPAGPGDATMLQQKDIEGIPGREAIVYLAEIIPGGVAGRHVHPGPELGYVLQGAWFHVGVDLLEIPTYSCGTPPLLSSTS